MVDQFYADGPLKMDHIALARQVIETCHRLVDLGYLIGT
jgi:hypothetical protein